MIQKIKPKLLVGKRNFCHDNSVFIDILTKLKNSSDQASEKIQYFFLNNVQEQVIYDKERIHISEWLKHAVAKYIDNLEIIYEVPPYRVDLKNMSTGDLQVWIHSTGMQFVLMFESLAFVYSTLHSGISSENDIYCYFDSETEIDQDLKVIHFTAILRSLICLIFSTQPQLIVNWSERQLHLQILYNETRELKQLVNMNYVTKMFIE